MDLATYRKTDIEKARASDLMALVPDDCRGTVLDIGARDVWHSVMLAKKIDKVTALDLEEPSVDHPKVQCVKGDAINLDFNNDAYDLVFCAEVLAKKSGDAKCGIWCV